VEGSAVYARFSAVHRDLGSGWKPPGLKFAVLLRNETKTAKTAAKDRSFDRQLPIRIVIAKTGTNSKLSVQILENRRQNGRICYGIKTFL